MLAEACHWWTARMRELLPASLAHGRNLGVDALIVAIPPDVATPPALLLRRAGQEVSVGTFGTHQIRGSLRRYPLLLRPAPGSLLETTLTLPLQAARDLHRVVGYELNRLTPFDAAAVFWTCRAEAHDRTRGRLSVRLSLLPKAPLLPLLETLAAAGLAPEALEVSRAGGPPCRLPIQDGPDRPAWEQRVTRGLAVACAALAVVGIGLPFLMQSIALQQVEARIAALQPAVSEAQRLRQHILQDGAGRDALAQEHARLGDTLQVLAVVTDLLPDDTVLSDLSLRQRHLTISGQSGGAPKLIAALAADPGFRNPSFAAPVTRNPTGADIFSIRTEVAP